MPSKTRRKREDTTTDQTALGAVVTLGEFLSTTGTLSTAERRTIVDQALVLIEEIYVHLPLKRAMHGIDPVQRLKLLRRRMALLEERSFHSEMIEIFKGLRDLHTNYILPMPFQSHTAFLPFLLEEFFDSNEARHYLVTRMLAGFEHPTFKPGVEVVSWSGVPIDDAVAINADREAGSNEPARHVRGLDNMTVRPMAMSLPPAAAWVIVGYIHEGEELEIRLPWQVFRPDTDTAGAVDETERVAVDTSIGVDLNLELTNQARTALFAREAIELGKQAAGLRFHA